MHYARHILVTGHAWLTALMMLVAGLPHFECLCPDGSTKSVCVVSAGQACCCNGACCGGGVGKQCCSAARAKRCHQAGTRSCCAGSTAERPTKFDGGHRVQAAGCSRSLAAQVQPAATPAKRAGVDAAPASVAVAWSDSAPALSPAAHHPTCWQTHLAAPPTDRVVALLRLVI